MKLAIVTILCMFLLIGLETAYACSVLNKEAARVGVSRGFSGDYFAAQHVEHAGILLKMRWCFGIIKLELCRSNVSEDK